MQTYMHKHIPLYYIHIRASNLKKVVEKPRKHWKLNQIKNELKKFEQQTVQTIKSWFISSNKFSRKTPATNANAKRLHTSIWASFSSPVYICLRGIERAQIELLKRSSPSKTTTSAAAHQWWKRAADTCVRAAADKWCLWCSQQQQQQSARTHIKTH